MLREGVGQVYEYGGVDEEHLECALFVPLLNGLVVRSPYVITLGIGRKKTEVSYVLLGSCEACQSILA